MDVIRYPNRLSAHVAAPPGGACGRPPLLMVHGLMAGAWQFENLQPWLAARGYASSAINLRGHHGSRPVASLGKVSVDDYIDDALYAARQLGRPVVIGQSMGGLIAQKLAESGVVSGAVLMCSLPPRGIAWRTSRGWIGAGLWHAVHAALADLAWPTARRRQRLLQRDLPLCREAAASLAASTLGGQAQPHRIELLDWILNQVRVDDASALLDRQCPESGRAIRQLAFGRVAVDARKVTCPVLSIVTGDDRLVTPAVGQAIARRYGSAIHYYAGRGHYGGVAEADWQEIALGIANWLETLPTPG